MIIQHPSLVADIDAFLEETGMAPTYLGKRGIGNSEVVARLRAGGRIWPDTETKLRSFMLMRLEKHRATKRVSANADVQGQAPEKVNSGASA